MRVAASTHARAGATSAVLTFLGTRGGIKVRSRLHWRHSALLIQFGNARIMIDCGKDWSRRVRDVAPTAIVLTHAHPDHAGGLADGAPCPVYATVTTWALLGRLPILDRREIPYGKIVTIGGVKFKAVPIQHSIRAPTVGFRVSVGSASFFYAPDIAGLPNLKQALGGIQVFIGDGAVLTRSMVRRKAGQLIGHAPVMAQLDWCKGAGVARAMFTHCGSGIVRGKADQLNAVVRRFGRLRGITASLACDGDRLILRSHS